MFFTCFFFATFSLAVRVRRVSGKKERASVPEKSPKRRKADGGAILKTKLWGVLYFVETAKKVRRGRWGTTARIGKQETPSSLAENNQRRSHGGGANLARLHRAGHACSFSTLCTMYA